MPVFTLSTLATVAGKSPDTMRDWFDRGFFGEAGRRTPGGQRRVRAASADKAVAAARLRAKGYERRRQPKDEKLMREFSAKMRRIQKVLRLDPRLQRMFLHPTAVLHQQITRIFFERTSEELEALGLPPGPVTDWFWHKPLSPEILRRVLVCALTAWMREIGSSSPTALADAIGVSRRSLIRRLGRHMGTAVEASGVETQNERATNGFDYKSRRNVPVTMSDSASQRDLRNWQSMCNHKQRSTRAPSIGGDDRFDDLGD
jgi:hypothetical protein